MRENFDVTRGDLPIRVRGASVTPEFFSVLGVDAALGRVFSSEIDTPGGEPAVVVSDAFWRSQLGGSRNALGRLVVLNDERYTLVGVIPPGFDYPPGTLLWTAARFRVPDPLVDVGDDPTANRGARYIHVVARLRSSVSAGEAQAEMTAIAERLEREYPDSNKNEGIALVGLVIGTAGALALTRLTATLIHGVSATDPPSYAAGTLVLATVTLGASYLPARRAARVDPMVALRYE